MLLHHILNFALIGCLGFASCGPTNIVLVITDDQDIILEGLTPMVKTQNMIANMGVTFTNAFVTTPVCCPSRASILSGQYQHNHGTLNNSVSGGCSDSHWQQHTEKHTWPALLHQAGYTTFYAGKYLNQYGIKRTGGVEHVPAGWDWWIGLVGNSRYYNYTLSVNGTSEFHGDDYLTDVIKMYGLKFLRQRHIIDRNFLMVLAPPAPHAPFTPAPEYKDYYKNVKALRTPNFNIPNIQDKHWLVRMPPTPLPDTMMPALDKVYRQRWETLLSVDDLIEAVVMELDSLGLLESTHMVVTSDHGYHVGQFGLPWDKRQPYEMDIRVPLLMRGPGVPQKQLNFLPVLNIDLAPTFLAMANLEAPEWMDGISFFPIPNQDETIQKRTFLIEYHGEGSNITVSKNCSFNGDSTLSFCLPETMCKCQDSKNNTFTCVRHITQFIASTPFPVCDVLFCKFKDEEDFIEAYDLNADPYQLINLASSLNLGVKTKYLTWLDQLMACEGSSCSSLDTNRPQNNEMSYCACNDFCSVNK